MDRSYIEDAMQSVRVGQNALEVLKSPALQKHFNDRWQKLIETFMSADPSDTERLSEICRQGKELQALLDGLEQMAMAGIAAQTSLAEASTQGEE